jgi:PAS domain S-box-containing protein
VADALIATDSEGNIAFMNAPAAELTGWECDASKGKPLLDVFQVFDETTNLPVVNPLDDIYDGRELHTGPRGFKLKRGDGSDSILVEAELSANRDEGLLLGIIVVFRDVTARRKAEKQHQQLQKMNSLALMATGLGRELAESQRRMDNSLKQLIAQSSGSTLRLLGDAFYLSAYQQSVVQQLIALGRTDPGKIAAIDLNEVLRELEVKFKKALGSIRSLNMKLVPGIAVIKTDPVDLRENLFRLVADARDAMPDGGVMEISTMATVSADIGPSVQLAIRDTGKGIRANTEGRVFDPYFQSRHGKGNPGFSLALVYQFVAMSGGSIEVESAPGAGTAYVLSFPAPDLPDGPPKVGQEPLAAAH